MRRATRIVALVFVLSLAGLAQTIAEKTKGMQAMPGYFPLYYDAKTGKVLLEIPRWNTDFLYVNSLPAGVGSNDVGLDRGQIGGSLIVHFERSGPKALLVAPNQNYRALTSDEFERQAVRQSFAQSVIWGFTAEAVEGDRMLVDATAFYLRDAHAIPETLARENQGHSRSTRPAPPSTPIERRIFRRTPKSKRRSPSPPTTRVHGCSR